ncbi:MAG TPA: recombinase family protein [Sedimentisphaerales bacterium]|nr:recombinase family protein [Sedimentisphaerales bacterium]
MSMTLNEGSYTQAEQARGTGAPPQRRDGLVRCAIYTRKSTDEGLDQDFNSLDAQRESAEAYILSHKHEGWACLPERYDDGGFTGGNMERPALKRLLTDIEAGEIDCVVVYKVDRLSRSLLDFARIMETFEKHGVSFVSVTQQFNTTNSMGRLTMNILLSFAQFEREIIAERTRDKMSAARRKGKWMGGGLVLGYDVAPRGGRLVVNEEEAAQVRAIYELYLEHRSLIPVVRELDRRGWRNKRWITKKGNERGGAPFTKNTLFRLLTNVIYIGKVSYKGTIYPGEHDAIVDAKVWKRVQELLRRNGRNGGKEVRNKYGALLKGLLYCVPCNTAMVHTYTAKKNGRRYRYYVCLNAQQRGWDACPTKSVNAHDLETFVVDHIRGLGSDGEIVAETIRQVREKSEKRMIELERERRSLERKLRRLHAKLRELALMPAAPGSDVSLTADRLADLQDQIRSIEQRMTAIREEVLSLERETVDERDLVKALSIFDPVWESLNSRERHRVMHLLIDRIAYDGRDGSVTVSFRSLGLKALCSEANMVYGGEHEA